MENMNTDVRVLRVNVSQSFSGVEGLKIMTRTKQFGNRIPNTRGASGKTRFSNQVTE